MTPLKLRWVSGKKAKNPDGEWQIHRREFRFRAILADAEQADIKLPSADDWEPFWYRTPSGPSAEVLRYRHGQVQVSELMKSLAAAGVRVVLDDKGMPPELGPLFDTAAAGRD